MFPNGNAVAAACSDGSVNIFDVRAQQCVQHMTSDKGTCTGVTFSISGRALYTSHESGHVGCWEPYGPAAGCKAWVAAHTSAGTETEKIISSLSLSPDGTALATTAYDSMVKIWAPKQ